MKLNEQIEHITPSASMVVMAKAKKLKQSDPTIIDMSGGEPDFDTPRIIRDEAKRQLDAGYTHYTVGLGLPELREKIAEKLRNENGCGYTADGIIVTPGAKMAIYLAVRTVCVAGDEVIYVNPAWVSYPSIIESANAVPVAVDLDPDDGYRLDIARIEDAITARTKMLILNYPNNPTGRLLSEAEADALHALMLRHPELIVLSDEIYERIVYDGRRSVSAARYSDTIDRVITVNGFSKSVAMTGWRVGYLAAGKEIVRVASKLYQHTVTCESGFVQKAAVRAFECEAEIEEMRKTYEMRRNLIVSGLKDVPHVFCPMPEGAFYAWIRFDLDGLDSNGVCEYLLEKAKVVGVPGISYGEKKGSWMRFSFATATDQIKKMVENITKAMNTYDAEENK